MQPDSLSPAGVFLVAVSLCSGAVLEQAVVSQALVTFRQVFSANIEATALPTLNVSEDKSEACSTSKVVGHLWSVAAKESCVAWVVLAATNQSVRL